jgi:hypothetical protein
VYKTAAVSSPVEELNVTQAAVKALALQQWYTAVLWNVTVTRLRAEQRAHEAALEAARRVPYNYATWMRVHNCEQPETWHAGGYFGNGLPAGGNGLGFSLYAWADAVRYAKEDWGVTLPSSGWNASPDQQMQAAQAMLDRTGGGPACL